MYDYLPNKDEGFKSCDLYYSKNAPDKETWQDNEAFQDIQDAYVITNNEIYYLNRKRDQWDLIKDNCPTDIIDLKNQLFSWGSLGQDHVFCIKKSLSPKGLVILSTVIGNSIYRPDYIIDLVDALAAIEGLDDFDLQQHKQLYINAVDAYANFAYQYCCSVISLLKDIRPQDINYLQLTQQKKKDDTVADDKYIDELFKDKHTFKKSEYALNPENAQLDLKKLLSQEDAEKILSGYYQLQRLLPRSRYFHDVRHCAALYRSVLQFNEDLAPGSTYYVDFIMKKIQETYHIQPIANLGTNKERKAITVLLNACNNYLVHLGKGLDLDKLNNINNELTAQEQKYKDVLLLQKILQNQDTAVPNRLDLFFESFEANALSLSKHRDNFGVLFLKQIGLILSALCFGAGLIYSKQKRGTYNFFKSDGEVFCDNVNTIQKNLMIC